MADLDQSMMSSFTKVSQTSRSRPSLLERTASADDELNDLPSPSEPDSDDLTVSDEDEHGESDAEREWRESIQQFELLMSLVLVPYLGKYFGRKFAYWGWKQIMEWRYPVEIVTTSPAAFRGAGMVSVAAASL